MTPSRRGGALAGTVDVPRRAGRDSQVRSRAAVPPDVVALVSDTGGPRVVTRLRPAVTLSAESARQFRP
jgi:hypothetical protein